MLKPGGHLLAFAGSRTFDLMTLSIRFAGFDIRDGIAWLYGSGFPKSLDVSKAIDKAAGATREVVGHADRKASLGSTGVLGASNFGEVPVITAPATPAAQQWAGWGTALKPAFEPIVVARKPLIGTVAANVLAHGTGALNIDGTRVGTCDSLARTSGGWQPDGYVGGTAQRYDNSANVSGVTGRWPANVVMDGDTAEALDEQSGTTRSPSGPVTQGRRREGSGWDRPVNERHDGQGVGYGDAGGASRYFPVFPRDFECCDNGEHGPLSQAAPALPTFRYQAKAPSRERPKVNGVAHPTVKPLELMRWLVRLVTPPGGVVLEPFAGSGATVEAAVLEGFQCIAIEREADYLPLAVHRLERHQHTADGLPVVAEALALFDFEEPA